MPYTTVRDWLAIAASSLSALFAGLIWWMARKRLSTRFEMVITQRINPKTLAVRVTMTNRSDERLFVEAISVNAPLGILVDSTGGQLGEIVSQVDLGNAKPVLRIPCAREAQPEQSSVWTMLIHHDNEFRSCKTVSIALHILKSFPVIRHKKKQLTAILPEDMRTKTA